MCFFVAFSSPRFRWKNKPKRTAMMVDNEFIDRKLKMSFCGPFIKINVKENTARGKEEKGERKHPKSQPKKNS